MRGALRLVSHEITDRINGLFNLCLENTILVKSLYKIIDVFHIETTLFSNVSSWIAYMVI